MKVRCKKCAKYDSETLKRKTKGITRSPYDTYFCRQFEERKTTT